jgi:serine/threonine protein kinase
MTGEEILLAALEKKTPAERAAYLDDACGKHTPLRAMVEGLLQAHAEAGSFLEQPLFESATSGDQPAAVERPGTVIGPYKLLQQLGEGGMGTVFLAEQTQPVQRKVALKIIKSGMDSRQILARFEAERQALALMDHPNIAKVLDAGTVGEPVALACRGPPAAQAAGSPGRPYFVMELVKGVPITKYCDEHHLTLRQRLELFVPVCQAVQHAHTKGIIHRDLKPSNVMVCLYDGRPVPKVIDFGVAKATGPKLTDRTLFTEIGQIIGTLEYMSPEQAELNQLDIDTRSDIYSLGVLLYELLTGTTPLQRKCLKAGAFLEVLRVIREEDPPTPSTRLSTAEGLPAIAANRGLEPKKLSGLLRGELDWIVMKALEKDRNRRYDTAEGLAADVQRHLADEPVEACPPSASYWLRKHLRKHRAGVLTATALVALLLLGAAVSTWQAVRATCAEESARAAAAAEKEAKEMALAREAETRAVLHFVQSKVFAAARPRGQEGGLGRDVSLRRAVEAALPFVDQCFRDQPLIEARLRLTLGLSSLYLGDAHTAAQQLQTARRLHSQHRGPDHPDTLASMNDLASAYAALGRDADALQLREETLALRKARLGSDHPDTLRSMNNLANSYAALGRQADAVRLHEETLALRKVILGSDHPDTLRSRHNLASSYAALGRRADALQLREETLALRKARLGPDHPDTLRSMMGVANSYAALGRHADAGKLHEETLALQKARLGPDHPDTLRSMNNLANSYAALGRLADAVQLHEETLALRKAKLGSDHPDTLWSMHNLADSYATRGRQADALKLHEEALALQKAKRGPDHCDTLGSMHNLANSYAALGWHADALKLHEEALALQKTKRGPDHPDTLRSMMGVANSYLKLGRGREAVPLIDECVQRASGKVALAGLIPGVLNLRLQHFETSKDAAGCRATAEMWEKLNPTDPEGLYKAACFRAVTATVLGAGVRSDRIAEQAEADRALAWLKQAIAAGYHDAAHLKQDKAFDALRDRPDYQKLLAGLEAGKDKDKK